MTKEAFDRVCKALDKIKHAPERFLTFEEHIGAANQRKWREKMSSPHKHN